MKSNKRTQEHNYEYPSSSTYTQAIWNRKIEIYT